MPLIHENITTKWDDLLQIKELTFREGKFLTEVHMVILEYSFSHCKAQTFLGRRGLLSKLFSLLCVSLGAKMQGP